MMVLPDEICEGEGKIVYKGREIWRQHQFPVADGQRVRVIIESFDSTWGGLEKYQPREGVGLLIDKQLEVAGNLGRFLFIWPYPVPIEELRPPPSVEQLGLPLVEKPRRIIYGTIYEEGGIKGRLCLWLEEPFRPVEVVCHTQNGHIHVMNIWNCGNMGDGIHFTHNGAWMIVEKIENGFRYHCNDLYPDEDFNDIVFRIERCEE